MIPCRREHVSAPRERTSSYCFSDSFARARSERILRLATINLLIARDDDEVLVHQTLVTELGHILWIHKIALLKALDAFHAPFLEVGVRGSVTQRRDRSADILEFPGRFRRRPAQRIGPVRRSRPQRSSSAARRYGPWRREAPRADEAREGVLYPLSLWRRDLRFSGRGGGSGWGSGCLWCIPVDKVDDHPAKNGCEEDRPKQNGDGSTF
jgi:hypothetical protein